MFIIPNVRDFTTGKGAREVYPYPAESDTLAPIIDVLDAIAVKAEAIFLRNGWQWSGQPVTRGALIWRIDVLTVDALTALTSDPSRDVATIYGGRLSVEARRGGAYDEGAAVTVGIAFTLD